MCWEFCSSQRSVNSPTGQVYWEDQNPILTGAAPLNLASLALECWSLWARSSGTATGVYPGEWWGSRQRCVFQKTTWVFLAYGLKLLETIRKDLIFFPCLSPSKQKLWSKGQDFNKVLEDGYYAMLTLHYSRKCTDKNLAHKKGKPTFYGSNLALQVVNNTFIRFQHPNPI